MRLFATSPRQRRLRTLVLGVLALAALLWGAVDIVGVPIENLMMLLGQSVLAIGTIIGSAALAGWLLHKIKQRSGP